MKAMTSHERFKRMYEHREADRVPIIFSSDHSVPSSVSFENFRRIVELAKELGRY